MRSRLREKKNALCTGVVAVALVGSLVQAVVRSDGFEESRVSLNSGSVWVTNNVYVGRLNLESKRIEVRRKDSAAPAGQPVDLIQAGSAVATVGGGTVRPIIDATADFDTKVETVGGARVGIGGIATDARDEATAVTVDPVSGKTWSTSTASWASLDKSTKPTATVAGAAKGAAAKKPEAPKVTMAVGVDGVAHLHRAGTAELVALSPSGTTVTKELDRKVKVAALTSVGRTAILLDESTSKLQVAGGSSIDIGSLGDAPVLQQPGPARSAVLIATEDGLWDVPLDGSRATKRVSGGGATPVAPVWVENAKGSCAFAAWSGAARWGRWCSGQVNDVAKAAPLAPYSKKMVGGNPMTFRVNYGRAVLNDMQSGANLLVDLPKPVVVDDWDQAQDRDKTEEEQEQQDDQKDTKACAATPPTPKAKDDVAGTRESTPVIVPVLDNDAADPCDVLTVKRYTADDLKAIDGGEVAVVENGAAIQVTPEPGRVDAIVVPYTAQGKGGEATATVRVDIVPGDVNNPPTIVDDETVVTAGALNGVVHNVLLNDTDPDGDALTLLSVVDESGTTAPRFEANGAVTYEPPGNSLAPAKLTYTVTDGRPKGEATGTLTVRIRSANGNAAPTPRPDRALAFVGRTTSIEVLRNDSDPDGDPLSVASLGGDAAAVNASHESNGKVTFKQPATAGRYVVETLVSDGQESTASQLVVTVVEPEGNLAPVAVRDDVVARPTVPALVDLLANDVDPEGDLLAVTALTPPAPLADGSEVAVELLEMRVARVTAPPSLDHPVPIRYTVTDGVNSSSGVLVVRPLFASSVNLAPIVKSDAVDVKAGGTASVAVLRNDVDPEGEQLRITAVSVPEEGQGVAFVQSDQVRIRPAPSTRGSMLVNYTVQDPGGNSADSFIAVNVVDPAAPNTPPRAASVEGRVFSGAKVEVAVPLLDLDPDGDVVHLVGLDSSSLPKLGTVSFTQKGFVYEAYERTSGADTFRFKVTDGKATSVGTARIVIAPKPTQNTPPSAVPDRVTVRAGGERMIPVMENDVDLDGDALALKDDEVEGLIQPSKGNGTATLTEDKKAVRFQAPSDIGGEPITVAFSYGLTDGLAVSRGLVVVEVTPKDPENQAPIAVDDAMTPQLAGETVEIDVLGNDRDPDGDKNDLKLEAVDEPDARNIGGGRFRVRLGKTPKRFVYRITDGGGLSAFALVTIPVVGEKPLVVETGEVEIDGGKTKKIDVAAYASEKVSLDRVYEDTIQGLELKDRSGTVVSMRAKPDWARGAGFSYLVTSGTREAIGSVRVRITGLNLPPKATSESVEIPEGGVREIDLQRLVEDPDTAPAKLTFKLTSGSVAGKIDASLSGSQLTIRTDKTAKGAKTTVALVVSDGDSEAKITLPVSVIEPKELPPVAVADTGETDENTPVTIAVLRNDIDPAGDGLKIVNASIQGTQVAGSPVVQGDSIVFTPQTGSFGIARIAYVVRDSHNRESTGMVEVQVYGRPGRLPAPTGSAENGLVRVQWQSPTRGGSPATGYVVRDESTGTTYPAPSTSQTITGLTNGTPHRFRVAALNRVVKSAGDVLAEEWSELSPELIPDAAPAQMAAPIVTFDPARNNNGDGGVLHLTWSPPPKTPGSPITEYLVNVAPADGLGRTQFTFPASARANSFDNLSNGTVYSFTVRAKNSSDTNSAIGGDGLGPPSVAGQEKPTGVPTSPDSVNVRRTTDPRFVAEGRRADVTWSPAPNDGGGADTLQYEVESVPSGFRSPKVGGTSIEASGLAQERYQFRVRASNRAGDARDWSQLSGSVNVSSRPTTTSATMLPSNGAVQITSLSDQVNGVGSLDRQVQVDGGPFQTIPGSNLVPLTNGRRYNSVRIRTCNTELLGEGEGVACSEPVNAVNPANGNSTWVTPYGPPSVSGSASGSTITWSWNAQPDTATNPGGTSSAQDYGPGAPRAQSFSVTVSGQGGPTYTGTASATTQETRSVTISKGAKYSGSQCSTPTCRTVKVTLSGFSPGNHAVECWSTHPSGEMEHYYTYTATSAVSEYCFFGWPGYSIRFKVDGVWSNQMIWD